MTSNIAAIGFPVISGATSIAGSQNPEVWIHEMVFHVKHHWSVLPILDCATFQEMNNATLFANAELLKE
jgi:hypothetical protein